MLTQPCPGTPASQYGINNLKLFRDGRISDNKHMPADDLSFSMAQRAQDSPVSDFGHQLIADFPSITQNEAKDITRNLLRCAAHAASMSNSQAAGPKSGTAAMPDNANQLVVSTNRHVRVVQDRKFIPPKVGVIRNEPDRPTPVYNFPKRSNHNTAHEGLDRLDNFPKKPYLSMPSPPRSPSPERPPVKKQKVSFSGAAMDTDDARWYLDDEDISKNDSLATDNFGNPSSSSHSMSADIAISIADNVDQPLVGDEPLIKKMRINDSASSMQTCIANSVVEPLVIGEPHTKKPRLLERYNTEEAVAKAFGTSNE
jgi:hypothetical protein